MSVTKPGNQTNLEVASGDSVGRSCFLLQFKGIIKSADRCEETKIGAICWIRIESATDYGQFIFPHPEVLNSMRLESRSSQLSVSYMDHTSRLLSWLLFWLGNEKAIFSLQGSILYWAASRKELKQSFSSNNFNVEFEHIGLPATCVTLLIDYCSVLYCTV